MNLNKDQHLNDDQLIITIVEADDLPSGVREHLDSCHQCRLAVQQFENELSILGEAARQFSPTPKHRMTLPVERQTQKVFGSWKWRVSFGAAFSAVLVFVILWWSGLTNTTINGGVNSLSGELWEDEDLMTEISRLSENPLPQLYMEITGDTDPEFQDDFMEFVDPLNEDTSLSKTIQRKGVKQC